MKMLIMMKGKRGKRVRMMMMMITEQEKEIKPAQEEKWVAWRGKGKISNGARNNRTFGPLSMKCKNVRKYRVFKRPVSLHKAAPVSPGNREG